MIQLVLHYLHYHVLTPNIHINSSMCYYIFYYLLRRLIDEIHSSICSVKVLMFCVWHENA